MGAGGEDAGGPRRDRVDVQHDQSRDLPRRESFIRHPIRPTMEEAAHLRDVADDGESAATPAILAGAVFAFVVLLAAILIFLVFGIAHFS
jgi:hypothetical protein